MLPQAGVTLAVVGASGNVGRKIIELLIQRKLIAPENLKLFASNKSAGQKIKIAGLDWKIDSADDIKLEKFDLILFATESYVSKKYISDALKKGATVVDSSSLYRLDVTVPLIVSSVNKDLVSIANTKLYAIANCISSPVATVIAPLHKAHKISRIIISTYQSVSGAGKQAMDELQQEIKDVMAGQTSKSISFQRQIAFNLIPQIDRIMDDGFTYEEFKIMREVQKIVGGQFNITATAVRVPVMVGHSVSLGIEFEKDISVQEVEKILGNAHGVIVGEYKTPVEVEGSDDVYVGRIRKDPSVDHGMQMWLCSDNLRRGAATDMVEVAEELIKQLNEKAK